MAKLVGIDHGADPPLLRHSRLDQGQCLVLLMLQVSAQRAGQPVGQVPDAFRPGVTVGQSQPYLPHRALIEAEEQAWRPGVGHPRLAARSYRPR